MRSPPTDTPREAHKPLAAHVRSRLPPEGPLHMKKLATATLVGLASLVSLLAQPLAVQPAAAATTLRVGSFNIQSVSLDATVGNQRPWKTRRPGVIADILGEKLDVVGIQEANPSKT